MNFSEPFCGLHVAKDISQPAHSQACPTETPSLWPPGDLGCPHLTPSSHHLWHSFQLRLELIRAAVPTTGLPTVRQPGAGWERPSAKRSGCRTRRLSPKVASDPHLAAAQTALTLRPVTSWWLGLRLVRQRGPRGPKQIVFSSSLAAFLCFDFSSQPGGKEAKEKQRLIKGFVFICRNSLGIGEGWTVWCRDRSDSPPATGSSVSMGRGPEKEAELLGIREQRTDLRHRVRSALPRTAAPWICQILTRSPA